MRRLCVWTILVCAASSGEAPAQPVSGYLTLTQGPADKKDKDKEKDKTPAPPLDLSFLNPPADAPQPTLNPPMIGDAPFGSFSRITLPITTRLIVNAPLGNVGNVAVNVTDFYDARVPNIIRGSFKIAENESPRPLDRFFLNYDYYDRIPVRTVGQPFSLVTLPPGRGAAQGPTFVAAPLSQTQFRAIDLHRSTFGFEKTFFDGAASIGLRVPLLDLTNQGANVDVGPARVNGFPLRLNGAAPVGTTITNAGPNNALGDLSVILKWAPIHDRDVLSFGAVVTVPTGQDIQSLGTAAPHGTLLQPYVGFLKDMGRFYVHGFSSLAASTDGREATLLFNDIGLCYRLIEGRDGFVRGVVPTIEGHLTTPLNHRDPAGLVSASDLFVMTGGVHFLLGERTTLTFGVGVPMTGPRLFDTEAVVQLNWRF